MRVYLAHNFAARDYLRLCIVPYLEKHGHMVVSDWITNDSHLDSSTQEQSAVQDLLDIESCGALIHFANQFGARSGKGKYVELGYAIRAGKIVIVVDSLDPEYNGCVFYHLCTVRHVVDIEGALAYLGGSNAQNSDGVAS